MQNTVVNTQYANTLLVLSVFLCYKLLFKILNDVIEILSYQTIQSNIKSRLTSALKTDRFSLFGIN